VSANYALIGFVVTANPGGVGNPIPLRISPRLAIFPPTSRHARPDFRRSRTTTRGLSLRPLQPSGQFVGDRLISLGQFRIAVVRNGVEALHHAVNVNCGAQDLLFHPRRVGRRPPYGSLPIH